MVKNKEGGSKSKRLASKLCVVDANKSIRYALNEGEEYAKVLKMFGNGRCSVISNTGKELNCVIRSKFRGRSKRVNQIVVGSVIMIGLREWESEKRTCDVLEVYTEEEMCILRCKKELKSLLNEDTESYVDVEEGMYEKEEEDPKEEIEIEEI